MRRATIFVMVVLKIAVADDRWRKKKRLELLYFIKRTSVLLKGLYHIGKISFIPVDRSSKRKLIHNPKYRFSYANAFRMRNVSQNSKVLLIIRAPESTLQSLREEKIGYGYGFAISSSRLDSKHGYDGAYIFFSKYTYESLRALIVHEVGHLFGLMHCSKKQCIMTAYPPIFPSPIIFCMTHQEQLSHFK